MVAEVGGEYWPPAPTLIAYFIKLTTPVREQFTYQENSLSYININSLNFQDYNYSDVVCRETDKQW